jgi:hypothetical protein
VQTVAAMFRGKMAAGTSDAALAAGLRAAVQMAALPKVLRSHGVSADEQMDELADALAYRQSDPDRQAVE